MAMPNWFHMLSPGTKPVLDPIMQRPAVLRILRDVPNSRRLFVIAAYLGWWPVDLYHACGVPVHRMASSREGQNGHRIWVSSGALVLCQHFALRLGLTLTELWEIDDDFDPVACIPLYLSQNEVARRDMMKRSRSKQAKEMNMKKIVGIASRVASVVAMVILIQTCAWAQTGVFTFHYPDSGTVAWTYKHSTPAATDVVSFIVRTDGANDQFSGFAIGDPDATGTRTYTARMVSGLADGDHTLSVIACTPELCGGPLTAPFKVQRGAVTPPTCPPDCPPPPTTPTVLTIMFTDGTAATASTLSAQPTTRSARTLPSAVKRTTAPTDKALSTVKKAVSTLTTTTPQTAGSSRAVLVIPYNYVVTVCMLDVDGSQHCLTNQELLKYIPKPQE
jgi:hypothetical protein